MFLRGFKSRSGHIQFFKFPQELSSVEFLLTFSQFLLSLDCESICDPPGGDTLLAQGIYLIDYIYTTLVRL